MRLLAIFAGLLLLNCVKSESFSNSFDVIRGCKQYANVLGYNDHLEYFPTNSLKNVGQSDDSSFFRFAIQGPNDGHIRFGDSLYPYDKNVIEIVLSGWTNTKSVGRRQYRTKENKADNKLLAETATPGLLSQFRPTMFILEVFFNGTVSVRRDGEKHAFLQFRDEDYIIPADYMAFTKWDKDLIYFYDCPLKDTPSNKEAVLLNCTIVE